MPGSKRSPTRYRLMLFRRPAGPWRETIEEAREDAIRQGLGAQDEHVPDRVYLDAAAWVKVSGG
ncbi:hypothetical protein BSL82_01160 [Tardibacter chloracetimidivorans]|uniref:Uncharacterized protein n=1 Tax=Tardibacter chloracetimidivorans TaxID=1921510 RepID=A0A1L3ZR24_9SPHN|nr:hypothetical protein [Tardibacter chloracetimidivorans]API58074.1 hypothetical protein BSL82_01160 [Tardibacter chloracetimidivorans]